MDEKLENEMIDNSAKVVDILPIPVRSRANSLPEFSALNYSNTGSEISIISKTNYSETAEHDELTTEAENKKQLTNAELLKSYRLHFFVGLLFVIIVISVSLSWYYKNEAQAKLYASQAIFFNPRTRKLSLSDSSGSLTVKGLLGLDIPMWMLPLHCPIVMGDDPHHKECLWTRTAVLRVTHFQDSHVQCYNVSWESLGSKYLPHDCFYIDQAKWYGPSNQSASSFPIEGEFEYRSLNYTLENNGIFNNIVDYYWLSSTGAAIYVDVNNPIQITWNVSGNNQLCIQSNYSGPLYHKSNSQNHPVLNYTLCQGKDLLKTYFFMQTMFGPNNSLQEPDKSMFQRPHWSLKSLMKTDNITQDDVINLINTLSDNGFRKNIITLDGIWQKSHGDLVFDENRFYNVTEMMETLRASGCLLTLCVSPYIQYLSENFHAGVTTKMFVKDAGGEVTGLTNFQGTLAAILDIFTENGRRWYSEQLQQLSEIHQIMSYRLTYGQKSWLPFRPHFEQTDATPNLYMKSIAELFKDLSNVSFIVEHTSDSRHVTSLIPVATKLSKDKKCLTGAIETALTLGLMGYPFVMADGIVLDPEISENEQGVDNKPSRELYIRWLQMAFLFPAYQYSIAPWEYDPDIINIVHNLSVLRNNLVFKEIKDTILQSEVAQGSPIMRPVWWLNPSNLSVHEMKITDEFLIGNNLLVAPVLCEGVEERDVYIPPGTWENINQRTLIDVYIPPGTWENIDQRTTLIEGPRIARIYNVSINNIVMFRKRIVATTKLEL